MNREQARQIIALAKKSWACQVFESGTHNDATCTPDDPHGGWWQCGYRYKLSADAVIVERLAGVQHA